MLSDNVTEQVLSRKRLEELAAQLETEKEALRLAQQQARERANQLEAVFEAITDGLFIFDERGTLLHMNSAARELLAMPEKTQAEPTPFELLDDQGRPLPYEQWPLVRVLKGEVFTGATVQDIVIRARDGRDIQLNVSGAPVRDQDGQIRGAVMVMRDVTEQRRMVIERDRLLRQREQLRAKEMALRIANQQEAHAKELALRETKERMDEFLSIASHELRTPMTTIKGNIQLAKLRLTHSVRNLSAGGDDLQNNLEEIQMMLDRAERQVNVQNRLVRDLLDISRIEAGQLELRQAWCDLDTIVHDAVEDQRSATPTRTIYTELPAGERVRVLADAERIGQVISNYLTNALKYSPADHPVEVRLEKEGKMARVSVRDQGPGLTPSEQERVWERFYRVQGVERQRGFSLGLGLGLHICRAIIEQHQGEVGVESVKGQGSTFWFTLPLAEER